MGQNEKEQLAKIVCYGLGCLIAYYILISLLPYIVAFLALIGAATIYSEYNKGKRR
jgi:uncharacterized BrkB/YihY/UPF0761 family membrane protein